MTEMDIIVPALFLVAVGVWVCLPLLDCLTNTPKRNDTVVQYYTFPFGHKYQNGYVIVHGADHGHCREIMKSVYGDEWEYAYDSLEQAEKMKIGNYELKLVAEIRDGRYV